MDLLDSDAPDVHHHPAHVSPDDSGRYTGAGDQGDFYDDLQIGWGAGHASMTQLADNGQTQILQIPLAQGEEVPITIDYEFPIVATSGNQANVADRLASFDVRLELGGEFRVEPATTPIEPASADPTPPPEPTPTTAEPAPTPEESTPPAAAAPQQPAMPETGVDLRWPALGVAVLLALGALLVRSSRHREDVRGHH